MQAQEMQDVDPIQQWPDGTSTGLNVSHILIFEPCSERTELCYRHSKITVQEHESEESRLNERKWERRVAEGSWRAVCMQAAGRSQCCSSQMVLWDKLCWHCCSPVCHGHYLSASQPVCCPPLWLPLSIYPASTSLSVCVETFKCNIGCCVFGSVQLWNGINGAKLFLYKCLFRVVAALKTCLLTLVYVYSVCLCRIVLGSSGGSSCKHARVPGQGHLSRTDTGLFRTPICTGATVPPGCRHGQSVHSLAECQTQCRPSVAGTEALSAEQSLAPSSLLVVL